MSKAGITAAVPIVKRRVRVEIPDRRRPVCGETVEHCGNSFLVRS
jgi:hypothetical protein